MKRLSSQDLRIAEEAATWLLRMEDGPTAAEQEEFNAWIRLSARHLEEFLLVKAASMELDHADPQRRMDLDSLGPVDDALVSLPRNPPNAAPARRAFRRGRRGPLYAAVAALLALALAIPLWLANPERSGIYSTVGEQRTIKLLDGSVVYMNTRSRIQVAYTAQVREVQLLEGEALFVVERDPARPFRVMGGGATIEALGTRFNVYRRPEATTVSVIEGSVSVSGANVKQPEVLKIGEEVSVVPGRISRQEAAEVERRIAWCNRQLVFRAEPLTRVAAEFNRYNRTQIRIEDPAVGAREISGVFDADDPRPLIRFLQEEPDVRIRRRDGEILVDTRSQPAFLTPGGFSTR